MEKIKIALDWMANANHTGFFTSKALGFYDEHCIDVSIITPDTDDYRTTPAKKVELDEVDFALCPFESVISYHTKKKPFNGVAISALLREDLSAIACLKDSGIHSPKDLDGKTYASYAARYEDEIVRQMVKNDGGDGNIKIKYPKKLGVWNTIQDRTTDATWIFMNWEGVQAKNQNIALNTFQMKDYGIPYGYSPIIFADAEKVEQRKVVYRNFLAATKKGYLYAKKNPEAAVAHLAPHIAEGDKNIDLLESQKYTGQFYGNEDTWGVIELPKVLAYLAWLKDKGLEDYTLLGSSLVDSQLKNSAR
ncbi:MAG: ABC transporter substrate-binding protein [Pricia sp.]